MRSFVRSLVMCGVPLVLLAATVSLAVAEPSDAPAAQAGPQKIHIPGTAGRWDLMVVDSKAHRLYIADTSNATLDVVDTSNNSVVTQIPGLPSKLDKTGTWHGANGLALAPDLGRIFAADELDNSLHVFDTSSNTQIATVPTTQSTADSVAYDQPDHKVYVSNGDSGTITVFDASSYKILSQIKLPGSPEIAIYDSVDRTLRQNLSDTNQQAVIDPKTDTITRVMDLPKTCEPHGIGLDPNTNHMLIGCRQGMTAIIDGRDAAVLTVTRHIGGNDLAAYNPVTKRFYVASSSVGMGIFDANGSWDWLGNVKTGKAAHSLVVDPATGVVYVGAGGTNDVLIFAPPPPASAVEDSSS